MKLRFSALATYKCTARTLCTTMFGMETRRLLASLPPALPTEHPSDIASGILTLQDHHSMAPSTTPSIMNAIESTSIIYSYNESTDKPIAFLTARSCMVMRSSQEFSTCGESLKHDNAIVSHPRTWLTAVDACPINLFAPSQAQSPCIETHVFLSLITSPHEPSVDPLSSPPSLNQPPSETKDCSVFDSTLLIALKRPWRIRTTPSFLRRHAGGQD